MSEKLRVAVSYSPSVGFISQANHRVPRSLTALSLDDLRRRSVIAVMIWRGRPDLPVNVQFDLDATARVTVGVATGRCGFVHELIPPNQHVIQARKARKC